MRADNLRLGLVEELKELDPEAIDIAIHRIRSLRETVEKLYTGNGKPEYIIPMVLELKHLLEAFPLLSHKDVEAFEEYHTEAVSVHDKEITELLEDARNEADWEAYHAFMLKESDIRTHFAREASIERADYISTLVELNKLRDEMKAYLGDIESLETRVLGEIEGMCSESAYSDIRNVVSRLFGAYKQKYSKVLDR